MTIQEFSDEFDVLYDNASNSAPGLDIYEKSVFLTTAQEEIVLSYFSPKQNKPREGFDDSEKRQMDFSSIIKTYTFDITGKSKDGLVTHKLKEIKDSIYTGATKTANIKEIPELLIIVNEFINVDRPKDSITTASDEEPNSKGIPLTVVPIMYKEYARLMSKPFKRPKFYQAWRILDNGEEGLTAYLIAGPEDTITSYTVRYIKKPLPIILGDITGLTIDGLNFDSDEIKNLHGEERTKYGSELDPILHREIIKRAVELAVAAYSSNAADKIQLGNLSQTDIGVQ